MESMDFGGWAVIKEKLYSLTIQGFTLAVTYATMGILYEDSGFFFVMDFSVVLICASAIYLLRSRDTYDIQPSWRRDLDTDHYLNEKYPGLTERLVTPVVTDLESDGESEIITITTDYQLQILTAPPRRASGDPILPYVMVKSSVHLPTSGGAPPVVAMETGFIQPYNTSKNAERRTQVIVLVLQNMDVLCYSSDLEVLWRKSVPFPEGFLNQPIKALSVLVTSYNQQKGDFGSIYIGASFSSPKDTSSAGHAKSHMPQKKGVKNAASGSLFKTSPFSVHCLSGDTGKLRWSNLPKADSHKSSKADTKQLHWSKLSSYFFGQMPHRWSELMDTKFDLLDLTEDPISDDKHSVPPLLKPLEDIIGLEAHHIEGLPFGGMKPHTDHEHVTNPDTLVVHNSDGIQFLNISTGEYISRLMLHDETSTFADLEKENKVVKVHTDSANCQALADYVDPIPRSKFTGPMCTSVSTSLWLQTAFSVHRDLPEDTTLSVAPELVPSIAKRGGLFNNLMGRSLRSEIKGFDSLFLTSSGRLTSFSNSGHVNWQILLSAKWSEFEMHKTLSAHGYSRDDQFNVYREAFRPSITSFSLKSFGKKNLLLVLGWDTASLVDLYDGYKLAEHSLPCPPLDKPILEDFDADGVTDVIIVCQFGYIGLGIAKQASVLHTAVIGVALVLTVLLLSWFCKPTYNEDETRPYQHSHEN